MAERGLIEGGFGGEAEGPGEAAPGASELDPAAAALAMDAAQANPSLAAEASAYFRKQGRLVDIQTEHLHEQREVQISHLKIRRFSDRLNAGTQVFFILIATVIGLGLAVMVYDAFSSRSVVVEAFDSPPAMAARGLSGKVVAAGGLDALQRLQAATRTPSKALIATSAWASDIKVEVPETGVSIGEIARLLHARFGHDLHIDGDLVQEPTGDLALTIRGDDIAAKTFAGPPGDLDKLTTQAAEYVYGRSQPYQYASYLAGAGRDADALAFLPGAYAHAAGDADRAQLANSWANAYAGLNQQAAAVQKWRLAMSLVPNNWKSWTNLVSGLQSTEGEEAAFRESQAIERAAALAPKASRPEVRLLLNPAQLTWDLPLLLKAEFADAAYNGGAGATTSLAGPGTADVYGLMHDQPAAARQMAASDPNDPETKAEALLLQAYAALDRNDAVGAVTPMEGFWNLWKADTNLQSTYPDTPCYLAYAYGLAGRLAAAQAVFAQFPRWSHCIAFHGDVLEHAGDLTGAERVWAEGLRIGPDLPLIYLHRGVSALNRGDLAHAQADLATAHGKASHFADPLKAWGDLLAREGQWKAALAKYDEALQYAPAWPALRAARQAAALR